MNGQELLEIIGELEPQLIVKTEIIPPKKKKNTPLFMGAGLTAAAAAAVLSIVLFGKGLKQPPVAVVTSDDFTQTVPPVTLAETTDVVAGTTANTGEKTEAVISEAITEADTTTEEPAIGGDEKAQFYQPGKFKFDSIPWALMDFAPYDEVTSWLDYDNKSFFYDPPDSIKDYHNVYSFITDFNISKEQAREGLESHMSPDNSPNDMLTEEEFEILFSGDLELITKTIASEYSIVVGEHVYCPNWIYVHSIEDYKAAGITPEMIEEKTEKYSDLMISRKEKDLLSEKLSEFTGKDIKIY